MIAGLGAIVRRGVGQPIARPVAADDAAFLARKGAAKIAFRVLRRSVELSCSVVSMSTASSKGWPGASNSAETAPSIRARDGSKVTRS